MDKSDKVLVWLGVCLLLWALATLTAPLLKPGVKEVDLATWIQAVGSVAGIVAGAGGIWWQATYQTRQQERLRVESEKARVQRVREGAGRAIAVMRQFRRIDPADEPGRHYAWILDDENLAPTARHVLTQWQEMVPTDLPGDFMRRIFFAAMLELERACTTIDRARSQISASDDWFTVRVDLDRYSRTEHTLQRLFDSTDEFLGGTITS